MRYVNDNELELLKWDDNKDIRPKYLDLLDFVEINFDSLMDHKISQEDIPELCEYIISYIMGDLVENQIEKYVDSLYNNLFLYVYAPEIQTYEMRTIIYFYTSLVKANIDRLKRNNMFNDEVKQIIIDIGENKLNKINGYVKNCMKIEPKIEFPSIKDIYINNDFILAIISKFAVEESLVKEYKDWKPVDEKCFESLGGKYHEW